MPESGEPGTAIRADPGAKGVPLGVARSGSRKRILRRSLLPGTEGGIPAPAAAFCEGMSNVALRPLTVMRRHPKNFHRKWNQP